MANGKKKTKRRGRGEIGKSEVPKTLADKKPHKCMRCQKRFATAPALKRHSHEHLDEMEELKMLKDGHVPKTSKIGQEFKGKNKIIVG